MSPPPSCRYVIDANVFIQPRKEYYPFDLAPGYWDFLAQQARTGAVCTIDLVVDELSRGHDALPHWIQTEFKAIESTNAPDVIAEFQKIMAWVQGSPKYSDEAKAHFANLADGWLVAFAKSRGLAVVSLEVSSATRNAVKIPDLCMQFGIPYGGQYSPEATQRILRPHEGLINMLRHLGMHLTHVP